MKNILPALFVALSISSAAQHPNLDTIKRYYNSINKSDKIEEFYNKYLQKVEEDFPAESVSREKITWEKYMDELRNENSIITLYPKFKNVKNFNFSKDIYDFISFDTNATTIMYINEQDKKTISLDGEHLLILPLSDGNLKPYSVFFLL